jgi:hypothetical protein
MVHVPRKSISADEHLDVRLLSTEAINQAILSLSLSLSLSLASIKINCKRPIQIQNGGNLTAKPFV